MNLIQKLSFILMAASVLLAVVRLFRGPTLHDRLVAADTMAVVTTAGLVWLASVFANSIYLDVALLYGALAFIGVVAIARALEGKAQGKPL
jgi:multisubunit Na+/H+ antiporter MnhF subunit